MRGDVKRRGGDLPGADRSEAAAGMYSSGKGFTPTDHPGGRWPANTVLCHLPECRQVGTKQVKGPGWHQTGADGTKGFQGEITFRIHEMSSEEIKDRVGWASEEGTEEVEQWKCSPGCLVAEMDAQSGERPSAWTNTKQKNRSDAAPQSKFRPKQGNYMPQGPLYADKGGASRFFYCAKASRSEREAGLIGAIPCSVCGDLHSTTHEHPRTGKPVKCLRNVHPTVKPLKVIEWLAKLILPPPRADGQPRTLLVPFSGSGSEMIGALNAGWDAVVGIEVDPAYCRIACARVGHWMRQHFG